MPWVDAYAERKYQQVMEDTWGHLRAKPGEVYPGFMIFVHSLEGYTVLLAHEFGALNDSPWLHEDTEEYMARVVERYDHEAGVLYRFDGVYRVSPRGWRRYQGRVRKVRNLARLTAPRRRG